MKPPLILMSHGDFAKEALASAEMIVGSVENAQTISMSMEEGKEGVSKKLDDALAAIGHDDPVLIMVDIMSGTPCNVAAEKMYRRENIKILTGLNLGMVIEYAVSSEENMENLAADLAQSSREVITVIEKMSIEAGDYEE